MLPTTSKSSTCSSSKPAQDDSSRFEEVPSSPSSSSASLDFSDAAPFPPLSQNTRQAGPNLSHSDIVAGLAREEEEESEDEHEDSVWWTPSELRVSSSLPPLQDEADLSPQDIIERATALKAQGNAEFGKGEWEDALVTYRDALVELPVRTQIAIKGKEKAAEGLAEEVEVEKLVEGVEALEVGKVEEAGTEDEGESQELRELRSMLFANCAACLLKLVRSFRWCTSSRLTCLPQERWKEAVTACDDCPYSSVPPRARTEGSLQPSKTTPPTSKCSTDAPSPPNLSPPGPACPPRSKVRSFSFHSSSS